MKHDEDALLPLLRRFAATLAHEVNNPLGAMVMNAEVAALLLERGRQAELPAVLRQIQADAQRCATILRAMAEMTEAPREPGLGFPLGEIFDQVAGRLNARLQRTLVTHAVCEDVPLLDANRAALEFALYHHARDALATHTGVALRAIRRGREVVVSIQPTGEAHGERARGARELSPTALARVLLEASGVRVVEASTESGAVELHLPPRLTAAPVAATG